MRSSRRDAARTVALVVVVVAGLVVVRWGVTGGLDRPMVPPAGPPPAAVPRRVRPAPVPPGALLYLGGRQPVVAEAATGTVRRLLAPDPSLADASARLLVRDRTLVYLAGGAAWALPTGRGGSQRPLGAAATVLPSPRRGRVWLVDDDGPSSDRRYLLREVELDRGRQLGELALPYDRLPVAVLGQGVLVRNLDGVLEVVDPASGRAGRRFGRRAVFIDAAGGVVAWLDGGNQALYLHHLATGAERLVRPPAGIHGYLALGPPPPTGTCCRQLGAFSPDGRTLALFVRPAAPDAPGLALVDVASATARPLPGSEGAVPAGCLPCLDWRPQGDWLFFFSGRLGALVAAYRAGGARAAPLDLDLAAVTDVVPTGLAAG